MKRRLICVFCMVAMALSLYTTSVFAEDVHCWEFSDGTDGWAVNKAGAGVSITNESDCLVYNLETAGTQNTFLLSPDNLSVKGSDYRKIKVSLKNELGTVESLKVAFITDTDTAWDTTWTGSITKTVNGPSVPKSGEFTDYVIDMGTNENWTKGTIKRIRLLISNFSGDTAGTIYVDRITIGDDKAEVEEETVEIEENVVGADAKAYKEAFSVLHGAGLIERGAFTADHIMTRGEFAYLISHSLFAGVPSTETDNTKYSDVPGVYKYADAIRIVSDAGVMSGTGDGKFFPHRELTRDEAVAGLVKLTGYGLFAEESGGYPSGYYSVAAKNEILENVTLDKNINYAQAVVMLKNALSADYIEFEYDGIGSSYKQMADTPILSVLANVYEEKGIVISNKITSLTEADGTGTDEILIDTGDEIIRINDLGKLGYECLGMEVDFAYFADDEESKLLYINPTDNNDILEISSDEIDSTTTVRKLVYEINNRVKTENIDTSIVTIYNGRYFSGETDNTYKPAYGKIRLVDNDRDGKYDIIFVEDMTVMEVSTVEEETVFYNGGTIKREYRNYEVIRVVRNGKEAELSDLKEGDIALLCESDDKEYAYIEACSDKVTVEVKTYEQSIFRITASDGTEYKINPYFTDTIKTGVKYKFKLDSRGVIAGFDEDYVWDNSYAFIIALEADTNAPKPVKMKLYAASDEVKEYECDTRITVDGISYNTGSTRDREKFVAHIKSAATAVNLSMGQYNQVARINLTSDDKIKSIDTVMIQKNGALVKDTEGDVSNSVIQSKINDTLHFYKSGVFGGRFVIDAKTKVFNVPEDYRDYASYHVVKMGEIKEENYKVIAFNTTDYLYSDLVIMLNTGGAVYEENIGVVSRVVGIYDENYGEGTGVEVFADNKTITLNVFDNILPPNLQKGDVIRYATRYNGTCNAIIRLVDYSDDSGKYNNKLPTTSGSGAYTAATRFVHGKVISKKNQIFTLGYGAGFDEEVFVAGDASVVVYDSQYDVVERGSINELVSEEQNGTGSEVVVFTRYGVVENVVIYK